MPSLIQPPSWQSSTSAFACTVRTSYSDDIMKVSSVIAAPSAKPPPFQASTARSSFRRSDAEGFTESHSISMA
jgi:hypothetical protein